MPYIIQTRKGKEKYVKMLLDKHGAQSAISPIKEYVVCLGNLPSIGQKIPYALNIMQVTPEDAEAMLNASLSKKEDKMISNGEMVRITGGTYEGFIGLVRDIGKRIRLDVSIFGKVLSVDVEPCEIEKVQVNELWT